MDNLVSPKQVAKAMGVSESSLKRWCDRGLIPMVKTAGGHRRMPVTDVVNFLRLNGKQLVRPDLLGLPPVSGRGAIQLEHARESLFIALTHGDTELARRTVFELYLSGTRIFEICDLLLTEVFHRIGERWDCGQVAVYQERRACELCIRLLHELLRTLPVLPPDAPLAIGGTLSGDNYQLPTLMVELSLREIGWNARSFGSNLPAGTLCLALQEQRPRLIWLSVSELPNRDQFLQDFEQISQTARELGIPLVIGGRQLEPELRKQLHFTTHCDDLRQLVNFARSIQPDAAVPRQSLSAPASC